MTLETEAESIVALDYVKNGVHHNITYSIKSDSVRQTAYKLFIDIYKTLKNERIEFEK